MAALTAQANQPARADKLLARADRGILTMPALASSRVAHISSNDNDAMGLSKCTKQGALDNSAE